MDAEGWLSSELATFACAACGQPYGDAHIRLIAQREELYFVDLSCPHCGSQAVAIVTIQVEGESDTEASVVVPTREEPAADERQVATIGVDDVLDMHTFLEAFGGDVRELLAQDERPRR